MRVSVGRIVHFWRDDSCVAAIVVRVTGTGTADLTTFEPNGGCRLEENVVEGTVSGTWHWPERVE